MGSNTGVISQKLNIPNWFRGYKTMSGFNSIRGVVEERSAAFKEVDYHIWSHIDFNEKTWQKITLNHIIQRQRGHRTFFVIKQYLRSG